VPADVGLGVAVSLCRQVCRQVSPPRLVVARARRGRGPARTSCDRSGQPSCRNVGTSGGWTPHHRQGPGRSSAPESPSLHPPSRVRSPHAAPASPRRSPRPCGAPCRSAWSRVEVLGALHRILVLQRRSCSWRSISPRPSLGRSSSSRRPRKQTDDHGARWPNSTLATPAALLPHSLRLDRTVGQSTLCALTPLCSQAHMTAEDARPAKMLLRRVAPGQQAIALKTSSPSGCVQVSADPKANDQRLCW
jgi:hypothetical protein